MSLLNRIKRKLGQQLWYEPTRQLSAARLNLELNLTQQDLPGRYQSVRQGLGRTLRSLRGRSNGQKPVLANVPIKARDREMSGTPIVFMHRGNSDYLRYTLAQAQRSSPESPVYLLGDESNQGYAGVTHYPYRQFYQRAAEFESAYRHFSTNGLVYTRFDFQRWLILYEFLEAHGYKDAVYLDSDVMLCTDINQDRQRFADYDFAIAHHTGSVFLLNSLEALRELGDFLLNIYTKRDRYHYDRIVGHYLARHRNKLAGGACDMNALYFFHEANYGRVGDLAAVRDGTVYDLAIGAQQGFVMEHGHKRIRWERGIPYGTLERNGRPIRFQALHFQGRDGKKLIPEAFAELDQRYVDSEARAVGG